MKMTVEQIMAAALELPREDRALLADRLIESLDPAEDESYFRKRLVEVALRRRDEIRSGAVRTIPGPAAFDCK